MAKNRTSMEHGVSPPALPSLPLSQPPPRERYWRWLLWISAAVAAVTTGIVAGGFAYFHSEHGLMQLRGAVDRSLRERLAGARLEGGIQIGWAGRVAFGPVVISASRPDRPPVVRVETVLTRPDWRALLRGRTSLASLELRRVHIEAGARGEELSLLAEQMQGTRSPRAPATSEYSSSQIQVRNLVLVWGDVNLNADPLEIGPLDGEVSVSRRAGDIRFDADMKRPSGGRGQVHLESREGVTYLSATLEDLPAQMIPTFINASLPFRVENGRVAARIQANGLQSPTSGAAQLEVDIRNLVLAGERLSTDPVGPMRVGLRGQVRWDWRTRQFSLADAELSIGDRGEARSQIAASLALQRDPRFTASAHFRQLPYAAALEALPAALVPPADAPRLDGPISGDFALSGSLHHPEHWKLDASLDISGLKRAARFADPPLLTGAFRYRPESSDRQILVGPRNPDFVRIGELPPYVVRAITLSEDAGFYGHQGFDFAEIQNAFTEGTEAGRVVRGGSTISQQLAKNLYLSGERTIARKVREALLTVALEASLGKSRLLELYLNIVEWGPGIYGLGEAARYYFAKSPRALTPREAAFLASIIPNPLRYHVYYVRGALTATWNARVNEILFKMREVGQLADDDLMHALAEPLVFARG